LRGWYKERGKSYDHRMFSPPCGDGTTTLFINQYSSMFSPPYGDDTTLDTLVIAVP